MRGLDDKTAGNAAAATIKTWMKTGMSTTQSARFSQTGARQRMVEAAMLGGSVMIDEYMSASLDFMIHENYSQEKSETL